MTTRATIIESSPLRVLIVEDEADLRDVTLDYLQREGCQVTGAGSIADCAVWLADPDGGVIVLDLGLPDGDGLAALRPRIDRRRHALVLATARGHLEDRIRGYEEGGDAYLVKPVDLRELTSVVRGVASRLTPPLPTATNPATWTLDILLWRLMAPDGSSCSLTLLERRLMYLLAQTPGEIVSKESVILALEQEKAGKLGKKYDLRSLEILIRRLRQKSVEELGRVLPLETVYGVGYVLKTKIEILK